MVKLKICVVTGTRAEYGLLYWLMKEIQIDVDLELQIIATGMHLSPEFGCTYQMIEADGFVINEKVEMLLSSDTPVGIAKSIGLGVIGFADALDRLKPDIMVVLGDRYEILAAVQAAMVANIPIVHLSGGELTEGAIDESIRHSITKMAQLHFVGAEEYRRRVIQMGENPDAVFSFGDVGIENIQRMNLLSRKELEESIQFKLDKSFFLVTYHPETLSNANVTEEIESLIEALKNFPEMKVIFTKPNSDAGGRKIIECVEAYARKGPDKVYVCSSLGQVRYLSAMKHCEVVVGNSSSGIVEAPAMGKPSVNIGIRQKGRLQASSIINCEGKSIQIIAALKEAMCTSFQQCAKDTISLYEGDNTSMKIKEVLKTRKFTSNKKFYDVNYQDQ